MAWQHLAAKSQIASLEPVRFAPRLFGVCPQSGADSAVDNVLKRFAAFTHSLFQHLFDIGVKCDRSSHVSIMMRSESLSRCLPWYFAAFPALEFFTADSNPNTPARRDCARTICRRR